MRWRAASERKRNPRERVSESEHRNLISFVELAILGHTHTITERDLERPREGERARERGIERERNMKESVGNESTTTKRKSAPEGV
jgi:hypothetical protein